jgi:hypothetical protein
VDVATGVQVLAVDAQAPGDPVVSDFDDLDPEVAWEGASQRVLRRLGGDSGVVVWVWHRGAAV